MAGPMQRVTLTDTIDALRIVEELIDEHADAIAAAGGDLMAVPVIAELLEQAEGDFKAKAERVAIYVRDLEARASHAENEAKRLKARSARLLAKADGLERFYLLPGMRAAGITKIEGDLLDVRVQESSTPKLTERMPAGPKEKETFPTYVRHTPERVETVPETYEWDRDMIVGAVRAYRAAVKDEEKAAKKAKRAPVPIEPPALPPAVTVEFTVGLRYN